VLIDTHVFLWWVLDTPQLTPKMREILSDGSNDILFSVASAYELAYKAAEGRLALPEEPGTYVAGRLDSNGFDALPINLDHALMAATLPRIHGDPIDRLLIAQAKREGIPILTVDPVIGRYDVDVLA
jgi:PIN domain nuclease of toxin-antitoxin system